MLFLGIHFVLAGRGMGFDFFPATFFNLLVEFLSFAYFFMEKFSLSSPVVLSEANASIVHS